MNGVAAQAVAVQAIQEALAVPASTRFPPKQMRPREFVVVSRIGGGADDWALKTPRFLIECYAASELDAERLADRAWDAWSALRAPAPISSGYADNNLTRYDNPDTEHVRFQFTGGLRLRR